ncbi:rCG30281 [Rattus norvegicus]|uniref:RCG30281 n=1 Tax=Rattus norvegicus TaxID=10116 RepID=A6IN65_RAT|nr:rCG30281 [Rattus norvegicus]
MFFNADLKCIIEGGGKKITILDHLRYMKSCVKNRVFIVRQPHTDSCAV